MKSSIPKKSSVIMRKTGSGMSIVLNRSEALNSLNLEMVRLITGYLNEALADDDCKMILFYGLGDRGFCAGGVRARIIDKNDQPSWHPENINDVDLSKLRL